MSPEHRKKLSEAHKKRGDVPPSRKGIPPWNKNRTGIYSEETIGKMRQGRSKQVIKHSEETRRKIGLAHSKEKSTFWKGGISIKNRSLRENVTQTFEYRQWRSDVFTRDNYICQHCGVKGGTLNVDHIKEFAKIILEYNIKTLEDALKCAELWNINNGRILCVPCHKSRKSWDRKNIYGE